jgi:5-methyltetrahydropteroyltriglutamate--homocysteine methyltransferase
MKRSADRILTTHAGRLDGPPELMQMTREVVARRSVEPQELQSAMLSGIADVIRRQADAGIDMT